MAKRSGLWKAIAGGPCARNDSDAPDSSELVNDRVGHAIGEIFLLIVMGEILERQHRNPMDFRRNPQWASPAQAHDPDSSQKTDRRDDSGYPEP